MSSTVIRTAPTLTSSPSRTRWSPTWWAPPSSSPTLSVRTSRVRSHSRYPIYIAFCWIFSRNLQYLCHPHPLGIFAAWSGLWAPHPPDCGEHCHYCQPRALPQRHQRHHLHQHPERLLTVISCIGRVLDIRGQWQWSPVKRWDYCLKWKDNGHVCVLTHFILLELLMATSVYLDVFKIVGQEITAGEE